MSIPYGDLIRFTYMRDCQELLRDPRVPRGKDLEVIVAANDAQRG